MEAIRIKRVDFIDVDSLQKISKQTFVETFSATNTAENMTRFLEESYSIAQLTTELEDINSQFYFALLGEEIIGYLKLNTGPAQTERQDEPALEVERIYVARVYQGRKVGGLLFEKALQVGKQINANYLWLGVWEENLKAISFYKKSGLVEFGAHVFRLGDDEQTDILMKLPLRNP